jgi:hypothetical protein
MDSQEWRYLIMLDKCLAIVLLGCISIGVSGCESHRDPYKEKVTIADDRFKFYRKSSNGKNKLLFSAPIDATLRIDASGEWCEVIATGGRSSWRTPLPCQDLENMARVYTEDKAGGNPYKLERIRESIAYEKAEKARLDNNG